MARFGRLPAHVAGIGIGGDVTPDGDGSVGGLEGNVTCGACGGTAVGIGADIAVDPNGAVAGVERNIACAGRTRATAPQLGKVLDWPRKGNACGGGDVDGASGGRGLPIVGGNGVICHAP